MLFAHTSSAFTSSERGRGTSARGIRRGKNAGERGEGRGRRDEGGGGNNVGEDGGGGQDGGGGTLTVPEDTAHVEEAYSSEIEVRHMTLRLQSFSTASLTLSLDVCWCKVVRVCKTTF